MRLGKNGLYSYNIYIGSFVDMHNKLNQAVKMYDRLLEERLANSYARGSYPAQDRVQSPHQYYASPPVSNGAYAPPPPTDQSSLYPNAVNYNAPQFPQPSAYETNHDSAYPTVPSSSSSSAPYMYNAPPSSSYPASSYPAQQQQQQPSGPPQEYQTANPAQGSAPPQEYQPQPTPQGTAPPHQGFLPSQGYFPPTPQGTTPPQENYYAPQAPEANLNVPPAQNQYAPPPNEYQPSPHGYVSPPGAQAAPGYAPDPYYGAQQQPQQVASPQQHYRASQQQAPPPQQQQQWDGYPQQPYPQQHDRNSFSLPGAVPQQKQQPVVEEAPLIDL